MNTVGYGDFIISSLDERFFRLDMLIFGTVFYSWIISYISNYIKKK